MHRDTIAQIIREMDSFGHELAQIGEAVSVDDRSHLISLRRRYAEMAQTINDAVEKALLTMTKDDAAELQKAFRDKTGEIRKATAEHQTNFPAVSVADDPFAYRTSINRVSSLQQDLLLWLKTVLLPALPR